MKNSLIIKIGLFVGVFIAIFSFNNKAVFGASATIPLNTEYSQYLISNLIGGSSNLGSVPSFTSIVNGYSFTTLPALYDNINQSLYNSIGYDFDDAINDTYIDLLNISDDELGTSSELISSLTGGLYGSMNELNSNGLVLGQLNTSLPGNSVDTNVNIWGTFFDSYVVGAYDEVSGTVSKVFDNVVYKIKDGWNTFWNEYINSDIVNFSASDIVYTKSFSTSCKLDNTYPSVLHFSADSPVFYFTPDSKMLYAVVPEDIIVANTGSVAVAGIDNVVCTSGQYSGQKSNFFILNPSIFGYLDGVKYIDGAVSFGGKSVFLDHIIPRSNLTSIFDNELPLFAYDFDDTVQALLGQLEGCFLTTADLLQLIDILSDEDNVGVITQEGTQEVVLELDDSVIQQLQDIIDHIIELSLTLENEIDLNNPVPDPDPDPDPEPDPDGSDYIDIVPPLPPVNTIGEVLTIPFLFSSIFQPVFMAFGGNLFSLWLFIPVIIVFIALIWALK